MKKSLIALASLALCGAAAAQSSVTLFGIVDATLAYGSGSLSNKTQLTNSGYNSSRVGFKGVESLGGDLRAGFHLEAGMSNDDGQGGSSNSNNQVSGTGTGVNGRQGLTFNRRSTVSIGGNWGELRLGRDYTPQFWNLTIYDPFGTNGVGTNQAFISSIGGPVNTRASNSITYLWGHDFGATFGAGGNGVHAALQHYRGENPSGTPTSKDGTGSALRIGYNGGPVSVALATSSTSYSTGDIRTSNVGGAYDFGAARVMGMYQRDRVAAATAVDATGYLLGVSVPVSVDEIRAAYSRYKTTAALSPTTTKLALGYVHNLSKRTLLYVTAARVTNNSGASQALNGSSTTAGGSSTGWDFGLRHSF
jgi:predicted porin